MYIYIHPPPHTHAHKHVIHSPGTRACVRAWVRVCVWVTSMAQYLVQLCMNQIQITFSCVRACPKTMPSPLWLAEMLGPFIPFYHWRTVSALILCAEDVFLRNPNFRNSRHRAQIRATIHIHSPKKQLFLSSRATTLPGNAWLATVDYYRIKFPTHEISTVEIRTCDHSLYVGTFYTVLPLAHSISATRENSRYHNNHMYTDPLISILFAWA